MASLLRQQASRKVISLQKMGDIEIKDIYAYMGALSKFKKGQEIDVQLMRGEEKLTVTVIF